MNIKYSKCLDKEVNLKTFSNGKRCSKIVDPDVTSGDGVYSGYFTDFLRTSGQYRVRISAVRDGKSLNFSTHLVHFITALIEFLCPFILRTRNTCNSILEAPFVFFMSLRKCILNSNRFVNINSPFFARAFLKLNISA